MDIADFGTLDAECLCLTIDAFAGSAPGLDDLVERTTPIQEHTHQATFLPIGVFDTTSTRMMLDVYVQHLLK